MMLQLGTFQFSITSAAYKQLRRRRSWRWAAQQRLQERPARQFVGEGDDSITLSGVIYPQYLGGSGQLDDVVELAGTGEAQTLIDGQGNVLGQWVIESINDTGSYQLRDGSPRRLQFSLSITRYQDDA